MSATTSFNLQVSRFDAQAVLFDMDGTLTDSIAAVEAAWGAVARELGLPEADVIAATHGKRAIDNLAMYKPWIAKEEMDKEVEAFEKTILEYADAYNKRRGPMVETSSDAGDVSDDSDAASGTASSVSSRRPSSFGEEGFSGSRAFKAMSKIMKVDPDEVEEALEEAEDAEEEMVDMSVRILPGVRKTIDSLSEGRYAVATSGAKTYAHGAMTRVGITPPKITITADDHRLLRGKPFPDPFLLAAKELGFACETTVIFEDSPSGIKAAVASGATVIAVCTSHQREKISDCGAHYIVDTMEQVDITTGPDGSLNFTVSH